MTLYGGSNTSGTYRRPGTYDGALGRHLAQQRSERQRTVRVDKLREGDRLVEFGGYLVVRSVTPAEDGKVDVCLGDVTWDLRADLEVEVWRI